MQEYLLRKIEKVRLEPEHIRRRYVYMCLLVSMLFIFGIWMLTLKEGIGSVAKLPEKIGPETVVGDKTPSLNDLIDKSEPLQVTGQDEQNNFFESQFEDKNQQAASEGVTLPKQ